MFNKNFLFFIKKKKNLLFLISLSIFFIDFISKVLINNFLNNKNIFKITNFLYLSIVHNKNLIDIFINENKIIYLFLFLIYLLNFIYKYKNDKNKYIILSSFISLGGVLGNLLDRLLYNSVIDFINIKIYNLYVISLNFADISIYIGFMIIILYKLKNILKIKK